MRLIWVLGSKVAAPVTIPSIQSECAVLVGVATKVFVEWTWVAKTVKTSEFSLQAMWNWAWHVHGCRHVCHNHVISHVKNYRPLRDAESERFSLRGVVLYLVIQYWVCLKVMRIYHWIDTSCVCVCSYAPIWISLYVTVTKKWRPGVWEGIEGSQWKSCRKEREWREMIQLILVKVN